MWHAGFAVRDVELDSDGYKREYSLMTGWRHTMLMHCVFKPRLGRIAHAYISTLHMGKIQCLACATRTIRSNYGCDGTIHCQY